MREKIAEIIAEIAGVSREEAESASDIVAELGVNSLKQMNLIDELEEAFDISISVKEFRKIRKNADSVYLFVKGIKGE